MPCEKCNSQFTVFKRKRSCIECRRFYCNKCVSIERSSVICERCIVFTKRPLLRSDLLQLKPKDLIFYLQSKHISTAGCLEKEELVGLVLSHAQLIDAEAHRRKSQSGSPRSDGDPFKSFDNIRQTCQSFFSNITDNLSDSLAAFEGKANAGTSNDQQQHQNDQTASNPTIFTQPQTGSNRPSDTNNWTIPEPPQQNQQQRNKCKNNCSSPTACVCSTTSSSISRENSNNFNNQSNNGTTRVVFQDELPGPSALKIHSDHTKPNVRQTKDAYAPADDSSQSSFEELGAIGGISDESKTATDTNSIIDQWQILDPQRIDEDDETIKIIQKRKILNENPSELGTQTTQAYKFGKIQRRNSDSVLETLRQNTLNENVSLLSITADDTCLHARRHSKEITDQQLREMQQCESRRGSKCKIRQQIKKLRNNLQNAEVSEADMKSDLNEFLTYLETRTKILEHSDSEASAREATQDLTVFTEESEDMLDDDVGINVYATPQHQCYRDARLNMECIDDPKELEDLSVKQLKEILMLNRVDYRGCCEKKELLDRVERLWRELKETPSSNKLKPDELCKICMDAPIECIILECGHMATCTNCGKILSECPICRQYIVRVVRFFRA